MNKNVRLGCMLGDGIGPEIVPTARKIVDAAIAIAGASPIDWVDLPMGLTAIHEFGSPMPANNIEVLTGCDGWLLGPFDNASYPDSWKAKRERVPGGSLRHHFDLYANIRPSRTRKNVPSMVSDVDLVIVRENTEGFYPDRNMFFGNGEFMPTPDVALLVGVFTRKSIRRIAIRAFELARIRRKHVTAIHKSNVMPTTFGLFLAECRAVAADYPDVLFDEVLFDAAAALLVRRPQWFDVLVTENMFGDTLSDLAGELVGALGLSAALNVNENYAMAQAAHGSAPDIAGQGIANPTGMIISAAMLLEWLGERRNEVAYTNSGLMIQKSVDQVLAKGIHTADLGGNVRTLEFTEAILSDLAANS